jgi:hypothetical protein
MERIGLEHPTTNAAELDAVVNEGPVNHAETLGRLSLSHPLKRASIAMMEQEARSSLIDEAFKTDNIVDW